LSPCFLRYFELCSLKGHLASISQDAPLAIFSMDLSGLNFQSGVGVQTAIHAPFVEPVNHFPFQGLKEFFRIVSVGRCKFKLSEQTIVLLLQATIDGTMVDFRPQQISDHVFKFVVASRNVDFHIYNLRSFSCEGYNIFFNLWYNGGAHWQSEFEKYFKEEAA
jgi:hypothetical protein